MAVRLSDISSKQAKNAFLVFLGCFKDTDYDVDGNFWDTIVTG